MFSTNNSDSTHNPFPSRIILLPYEANLGSSLLLCAAALGRFCAADGPALMSVRYDGMFPCCVTWRIQGFTSAGRREPPHRSRVGPRRPLAGWHPRSMQLPSAAASPSRLASRSGSFYPRRLLGHGQKRKTLQVGTRARGPARDGRLRPRTGAACSSRCPPRCLSAMSSVALAKRRCRASHRYVAAEHRARRLDTGNGGADKDGDSCSASDVGSWCRVEPRDESTILVTL